MASVLGVAIKGRQLLLEKMTNNRVLMMDFLASSVEIKRGNERIRWREEWLMHNITACGHMCQYAVPEKINEV